MEPRGCQQPLCSLVKAEFLALTSLLSQLLEKQRKLICVNDRTENLAGDRPECALLSSKALLQPGTSGRVPSLACHSRGSWCLFKNQNPKIQSGPEILCPCMNLFSGLRSSPGLSQLHLFCSEASSVNTEG